MEKVDVVIIGAGVVGLAVAERISRNGKYTVLLIEKNERFGLETSSRNSEVIHSGIYYPAGSLKARLCIEGNERLYEECALHNIQHVRTGKLVIASCREEEVPLQALFERGKNNGVEGLQMLNGREVAVREPLLHVRSGLFVPSTGIINTEQYMKYLSARNESNGTLAMLKTEVTGIEAMRSHTYEVTLSAHNEVVEAYWVINCAGLYADRVAGFAGIDPDRAGYRLRYVKGEYYRVTNDHAYRFSHLVYPLPEGQGRSLGIHLTLDLNKHIRFGPNSYEVSSIDYAMDLSYKDQFAQAIQRYLPSITAEMLTPDTCGIRPQLGSCDSAFHDFVIDDEADRKLPGFINLIGIESPGFTAAPAIAEYVANMIN